MKKRVTHNHNGDGIDRRGFLECMAWVRQHMDSAIEHLMTANYTWQTRIVYDDKSQSHYLNSDFELKEAINKEWTAARGEISAANWAK